MAEEQKYVVTVERMSKGEIGAVIARASGIVVASDLNNEKFLPGLAKVTDAAVADVPIEIEPMTTDDINDYRDEQDEIAEAADTLVLTLL